MIEGPGVLQGFGSADPASVENFFIGRALILSDPRIANKSNRVYNPLGFYLGDRPRLSYVVTDTHAKKQTAARYEFALDESFSDIVYDSGPDSLRATLGDASIRELVLKGWG